MSFETTNVTLACVHCGSTEIAGNEKVPGTCAGHAELRYNDLIDVFQVVFEGHGETRLDWNNQVSESYYCGACGWGEDDLSVLVGERYVATQPNGDKVYLIRRFIRSDGAIKAADDWYVVWPDGEPS